MEKYINYRSKERRQNCLKIDFKSTNTSKRAHETRHERGAMTKKLKNDYGTSGGNQNLAHLTVCGFIQRRNISSLNL